MYHGIVNGTTASHGFSSARKYRSSIRRDSVVELIDVSAGIRFRPPVLMSYVRRKEKIRSLFQHQVLVIGRYMLKAFSQESTGTVTASYDDKVKLLAVVDGRQRIFVSVHGCIFFVSSVEGHQSESDNVE